MRAARTNPPHIAIACGGTGGHLFPGLAVAGQILAGGGSVTVLISPKDVDQQAAKAAGGVEVVTLPAVALQRGQRLAFLCGCWQSWRAARRLFKSRRPDAVLAMGGFTSAPPVVAARNLGVKTFLHESNTIPGRANRWLARLVDQAFVGFSETESRLAARQVTVTGTPVRPQFQPRAAAACRLALGLDAARPVVLVMGGSQGARGLNEKILAALPVLAGQARQWQWLHLTGPHDAGQVRQTYEHLGLRAVVRPFLAEMELALGAATACVSRAGASSLAELAAVRLPALLIPFPAAADNHQFHNARAFVETGAARLLAQSDATPEKVADRLRGLVADVAVRADMMQALSRWHAPDAAGRIAALMLNAVSRSAELPPAETASAPAPNQGPTAVPLQSSMIA